jgi:hypothetical protein
MSKLHMRARKLDYSRRLHVYRAEEVPDLDDQTQFARSVPVVATGVEKEEEEVRTGVWLPAGPRTGPGLTMGMADDACGPYVFRRSTTCKR